jgi:hypothetical protein
MVSQFLSLLQHPIVQKVFYYIWVTSPVWISLFLIIKWFKEWIEYKQREWINLQGSALLEIKISREMVKSPLAMEIFLNTIYASGVGTLADVYLKGRVRPWFSLELVSKGGEVHFYIWCLKASKGRVESQLYAQFPNIEVHEVPDYTLGVHRDPEKLSIGWFGQYALTKADAYPIKTYIDYGLDKTEEEEYKNDPIVPILEYLGSLKRGENAWFQILIQAHAKEGLKYGRVLVKPDWKTGVEKEIKEIVKKATPKSEKGDAAPRLSTGQTDVIKAIERASSKPAFDTMIRATYFAEKDAFNANNIGGLIGSFAQFGSGSLNGFKPDFNAGYDYSWQDFKGKKKAKNEENLLEAYKRRSFFNPPFKNFHGKPFILTTEELATIFHFPSSIVAATPTLVRIPSKKAEAPSNLPV